MINIISKIVGKIVLTFFGWKYKFDKTGINNDNDSIIIFPHTTIFDFFIIIFYFLTIPNKIPNIYILMKPQVFEYFGFILNRINCIKCPRNEDKSSGFIKELISKFENQHFKILISPKGTRDYRDEWRKGFWILAEKLKANISVHALDYKNKELIYIGDFSTRDTTVNEFITDMKYRFSFIPQMYPDKECIQRESFKHLSIIELLPIDPVVATNNFMIIFCLAITFPYSKIAFLIMITGSIFSFIYHQSKEESFKMTEPIVCKSALILLFLLFNYYNKMKYDVYEAIITIICAYCYLTGKGRDKINERTKEYILYHSLFHLCISILLSKIILFN